MPTFNAAGSLIQETKDTVFITKTKSLSRHWWPKDREYLWHLSWSDFKVWLYLLEPREAMLLSNDKDFVDFREAKRTKGIGARTFSWIWRKIWA